MYSSFIPLFSVFTLFVGRTVSIMSGHNVYVKLLNDAAKELKSLGYAAFVTASPQSTVLNIYISTLLVAPHAADKYEQISEIVVSATSTFPIHGFALTEYLVKLFVGEPIVKGAPIVKVEPTDADGKTHDGCIMVYRPHSAWICADDINPALYSHINYHATYMNDSSLPRGRAYGISQQRSVVFESVAFALQQALRCKFPSMAVGLNNDGLELVCELSNTPNTTDDHFRRAIVMVSHAACRFVISYPRYDASQSSAIRYIVNHESDSASPMSASFCRKAFVWTANNASSLSMAESLNTETDKAAATMTRANAEIISRFDDHHCLAVHATVTGDYYSHTRLLTRPATVALPQHLQTQQLFAVTPSRSPHMSHVASLQAPPPAYASASATIVTLLQPHAASDSSSGVQVPMICSFITDVQPAAATTTLQALPTMSFKHTLLAGASKPSLATPRKRASHSQRLAVEAAAFTSGISMKRTRTYAPPPQRRFFILGAGGFRPSATMAAYGGFPCAAS